MKPTAKDKRHDLFLKLIIPLVRVWMFFDMRTEYIFDKSFIVKRQEPYVLLANHTFMFDVVHVPINLGKKPFIVASHNLFTKQPLKFLLEHIAHAIPKTKNASDIRTARELLGAVKRGYPILIFPEGNTTFNGETTYVEESTMKLIKKLKKDVVVCLCQGGYLSKPRWATGSRKNRRVKFEFKVVIKGEDIKNLSFTEISDIVNKEMYSNDYEYQRQVMIPHKGKKLAEGIENILYICPECNSFGTIKAQGNTIMCTHCDNEGKINDYGFIEGFRFDNTVEWDHFQREFNHKLVDEVIESPAKIYLVDDQTLSRKYLGEVTIKYEDKKYIVSGDINREFLIEDIKTPTVTLRRNFNITVDGEHYLIKIEKYVTSFLRVIQNKY